MELKIGLTGKIFENGYNIYKKGGMTVIGMSPGNSYFNPQRIDNIIKHCSIKFSQTRIFIPDKPMEYNLRGIGYSKNEAERKARLSGNTLRNHCNNSIQGLKSDILIVDWKSNVSTHDMFQFELCRVNELYLKHQAFRNKIRECTRTVLEKKLKNGKDIETAIDEGINYIIEELAFLTASPCIFETDSIAYVYHNQWDIFENYINGLYDGNLREDIGFVIIN